MVSAVRPVIRSVVLSPKMGETPRARALATEVATAAGFKPERVFEISVAVSEAAANAIEHSPVKGKVHVRTILRVDRLEVEIEGPGQFQTPDRQKDRESRGLGLPIMAKFSDHLALFSGPKGQAFVSLTFYRPGAKVKAESPVPPSFVGIAEEHKLLDGILTGFPEGFCVFDHGHRLVYITGAACSLAGKSAKRLLGHPVWEAFPAFEPAMRTLLKQARSADSPVGCRAENQSGRVVDLTAFEVEGGVAMITRDVTERERVFDSLTESECKYRSLVESMEDSVALCEAVRDSKGCMVDYRWLELNKATEGLLGVARPGLVGLTRSESPIPPDPEMMELFRDVLKTDQPVRCEHTSPALGDRWVDLVAFPQGGDRFAVAMSDVTERKQAESRGLADFDALMKIHELSGRLVESRADRGALLQDIMDVAVDIVAADKGTLQLLENDRLSVVAQHGHEAPFLEFLEQAERGVWACGVAVRTRERIVVPDIKKDPGCKGCASLDVLLAAGVQAIQSTPIISRGGELLGVLTTHWGRAHAPDEHEFSRLDLLVRQAGDIIDQNRVESKLEESEARYRAMAEDNERLYRQQLDIAESLQLALLNIPSEVGPVRLGHLYRSATRAAQVGGDFYDAFEFKDDKVVILVGDVAGHGIEAARTATMVKDVVRAFVHESLPPARVLLKANGLLVQENMPEFVTLFLAIYDTKTGRLQYSSAGHPEMLLKRRSGEIEMLESSSSPLGIYQDSKWKTTETELEAGDMLLLYTDGVIEARRDGEFFGQERLKRLLGRKRVSVHRLPHLILDKLLAFSRDTLSDDVALLALSVTELMVEPEAEDAPGEERLVPLGDKAIA